MVEEIVSPEKTKKRFTEKYAEWTLGVVSFVESSFFPVIVDPILVGMTLVKTDRWFRYATIATVASVSGAIFGYIVGAVFFDLVGLKLVTAYGLEEAFDKAVVSLNQNAFLFTIIGAFTPLPFKLVVLVGGFLKVNFFAFIAACIIGRSTRFYIVGYITQQFGERALSAYIRKLHIIYAAAAIAIVLYILMAVL